MSVKLCLPQVGQAISCSVDKRPSSRPGSCVHALAKVEVVLGAPVLDELVGTVSASLHSLQSISGSEKPPTWPEATQVMRVHQNSGVQADVVRALLHELLAPRALLTLFLNSTPSGP